MVKTDILYWDAPYVFEALEVEGIRLASIEEIGAMKLDAISRGGRKKDFWDIVEIFEHYSLSHLLNVYQNKYPYFELQDVYKGLLDFTVAEEMPAPICLKNRDWEMVKAIVLAKVNELPK